MKNLIYAGQFRDASGYASAAREYLSILSKMSDEVGFNLHLISVNFEEPNLSADSELSLIEKHEIKTVQVLDDVLEKEFTVLWHLPPPVMTWTNNISNLPPKLRTPFSFLKKAISKAKTTHSITTWETDKIPSYWREVFQKMKTDTCFVPSMWNVETYKKEKLDTVLLPHFIDCRRTDFTQKVKLPNLDNKYVFFSMSQWGQRKGFDALLRAYFSEFKQQKDVLLVIKTYVDNTNVNAKTQVSEIVKQIKDIKSSIFVDEKNTLPSCEVCIIADVLSEEKINFLYDASDCFVLATRGEGFGLTIAEAVSFEKPVIVPNQGGHIDYLEPNELLFDAHLSPCYKLPNYECDSNYYEPDILSLMKKMRYAFSNRDSLLKIANANKQKLIKHCGENRIWETLQSNLKLSKSNEPVSDWKQKMNRAKSIISSKQKLQDKVAVLKNLYEGETCYILNCGPSLKDYDPEQLREKLGDKLVFAVKQAYDYCPEIVDFHFFNCSNLPPVKNGVHYDYTKSNPITVASSNYDLGMRWSALQETDLFFKIPIRTEIDNEFLAVTKRFSDYPLEKNRPCGPGIMYETVIQTAVHLGVKKIVVLGWDLTYNKVNEDNYKHFYGNSQGLVNRGDILDWEIEATRSASKELFYWLKENEISLILISKQSSLYKGIPREEM